MVSVRVVELHDVRLLGLPSGHPASPGHRHGAGDGKDRPVVVPLAAHRSHGGVEQNGI